eukprot:gnl/TRDRNA2_/TRDRNA2_111302_c1_seq2.p1 gnl/TRDRNA2_/TRDRNA2_111302_c1~~gnl/TRDRNA2_/TRDRNA2_111302_c1_seq2.p1  ORF type:complete len:149 (-),score=3.88 gnl/TRDRNA2_/TRDRNA2_111302_c1_seq2:53-499(-)
MPPPPSYGLFEAAISSHLVLASGLVPLRAMPATSITRVEPAVRGLNFQLHRTGQAQVTSGLYLFTRRSLHSLRGVKRPLSPSWPSRRHIEGLDEILLLWGSTSSAISSKSPCMHAVVGLGEKQHLLCTSRRHGPAYTARARGLPLSPL